MSGRLLNVSILLFWIAMMTWLVTQKIMPLMQRGDPPSYLGTIQTAQVDDPPICWEMYWNDKPLGWAASKVVFVDGRPRIHSRLQFKDLSLAQLGSSWLMSLIEPIPGIAGRHKFDMRIGSRMQVDDRGQLTQFNSEVHLGVLEEPLFKIDGTVEANKMLLSFRTRNDQPYETPLYLPHQAIVGDELSPRGYMPGLRLGQTWTMPVYSPLRPPVNPTEILQAKVERREAIIYGGEAIDTLLVLYRRDTGSKPVGKLWVRSPDGMVLMQEMTVLSARLRLVRLPEDGAGELLDELEQDPFFQHQGPLPEPSR